MANVLHFRLPKAGEIDVRIGTISEKGLSLLLFQNARVAMDMLDETVGPLNWCRSHELIGDRLYCKIGINKNFDNSSIPAEWVYKSDVGVESNAEKEKGQASDAFKRAAVNWGICRCLYSAPFIWVKAENANIKQADDKNGKPVYKCKDKFFVEKILFDEDEKINAISIKSKSNTGVKRVFVWQKEANK